MNYILFDDKSRYSLLPFTHTRPVADIRCGIGTMRDRWEYFTGRHTGTLTEPYLQHVFPLDAAAGSNILINGAVFATKELYAAIQALQTGEKLVSGNTLLAANTDTRDLSFEGLGDFAKTLAIKEYAGEITALKHPWDIFSLNDYAIRTDFPLVTEGRKSAPIPAGVMVSGAENLFIEEGANIYAGCIINATTGPVYIGKDTEILEGVMIRGPLAVCSHGVVKMGAKVYGATTIGPGCKAGGEINNAVFFANSNKGHDGYLGNAVIGEWCNLGADTNCSNLKNNYDHVKVWDEHEGRYVQTGLTFCGLMMGDHSKCGINTMFNTGTVVGISCNIFGAGFPDKFIPSFAWGGGEGMDTYSFDKAMNTARRMMQRRNIELSEAGIAMYRHIFDTTAYQRETFTQNQS